MSSSSADDSSSSEASDLTTAYEFYAFADEDETSPKSPNNLGSQPQTSAFALDQERYYRRKVSDKNSSYSDPLQDFWKLKDLKYLRLSILAMKYLYVQATSIPSKRVFSKIGNVVSKKRNKITFLSKFMSTIFTWGYLCFFRFPLILNLHSHF